MSDSGRVEWIDAAKGLGMLLIMLSHMGGLPDNEYINNVLISGYVSMFFVLSGLTFTFKTDIKSSIANKSRRLLVPYFLYIVLFTVVTDLLYYNGIQMPQIVGLFYSRCKFLVTGGGHSYLNLCPGCTPMWFLTAMFCAYLLVYLWQRFESKRKTIVTIYALCTTGMSFLPILLPWSLDTAPMAALLIISGFQYKRLFIDKHRVGMFLGVFLLYLLMVYINGHANMSIRSYGSIPVVSVVLFFIIGILEAWIICVLFKYVESINLLHVVSTAFSYLGRQSLRLMCIHYFIWVELQRTLSFHSDLLHIIWGLIIVFAINHVIYIFCTKFKERIVILRYV